MKLNMKLKFIINYISIAGIAFSLTFGYLQSIKLGFEKNNMILTIKGENLEGIKVSFNNRFTTDAGLYPFGSMDHSNENINFNIPDYAYIRRLHITPSDSIDFKLKKVIFSGQNANVIIKNKDIGHFFSVPNHTYNPKTSTYKRISDSLRFDKFIIYSRDLSDLLKNSYIKRIPSSLIIFLSLLVAMVSCLVYYYITLRKRNNKIWSYLTGNILVLLILLTVQIIFFSDKIDEIKLEDSNTVSYFEPDIHGNLVYNGNFTHGLIFWGALADSTTLELIDTPFGKGVKVTRGDGDGGYWSLRYIGRSILYHKDHTYQIKFKYKIIKGEGIPFNIGWWVRIKGKAVAYKLKLNTSPLVDSWYDAEAKYTFLEDTRNPACFLNSLKDYSEVEITDVRILDLNREESQIDFLDQENTDLVKE